MAVIITTAAVTADQLINGISCTSAMLIPHRNKINRFDIPKEYARNCL
jgi:hypothetical protein